MIGGWRTLSYGGVLVLADPIPKVGSIKGAVKSKHVS
jgi:hypothetical protein